MIKLNVKAKKTNITNEFKRAIEEIKANAKRGVAVTELVFDKEIYDEVRAKINELVEKKKIDGFWQTMSGPIGMTSSIAYGNGRLMKFKIRG